MWEVSGLSVTVIVLIIRIFIFPGGQCQAFPVAGVTLQGYYTRQDHHKRGTDNKVRILQS